VKAWPNWLIWMLLLQTGSAQEKSAGVSRRILSSSVVELTPERLDFGSQAVGSASQPRTVTLTNSSNSNIGILDIGASGIDFTEADTCNGSLSAKAKCVIEVTFTPATTGPRLGTITISVTDSDPAGPHYLVLTGTGSDSPNF
jgi:hypothetical protein